LLDTFGHVFLASGAGILDVGGGKGELSFEMVNLNGINSVVVDPRPLALGSYRRKLRFGMYHRNKIWRAHNTMPPLADGISARAPAHMRCLFQVPFLEIVSSNECTLGHDRGGVDEVGAALASIRVSEASGASAVDLPPPDALPPTVASIVYPHALQNPELYEESVRWAKSMKWGKQGLKHEDESDLTDNLDNTTKDEDGEGEERGDGEVDTGGEELSYDAALCAVQDCSMVCGMHPDQATEHIAAFALRAGKPFAVVPCCVYSAEFPHRRTRTGDLVTNYDDFIAYLIRLAPDKVRVTKLPFDGKNKLVYSMGGRAAFNSD
jgi:hypothetical protein